jgi:hypothetical protein
MSSITAAASDPKRSLIRASVQGIVYLIDSIAGKVYTYNMQRPVFVGTLEKIPEEDKNSISKTNGCMATARVRYRSDIREIMASERIRTSEKSEAIGMNTSTSQHGIHS